MSDRSPRRARPAPVGVAEVATTPVTMPESVRACLFDLDGVLTSTATLHEAAWRDLFDALLEDRSTPSHPLAPFSRDDYLDLVDGRPRLDGIRAFLASRQLEIPEGEPDDGLHFATIHGLGARKNELFLRRVRSDGVTVFPESREFVDAARSRGLAIGVVSSSENAGFILDAGGLSASVDVVVDGLVAAREHLAGKPAPDTFRHAARLLEVEDAEAAVFEDAIAGVEAGRAGKFGWVVGIDRSHHHADLLASGADVVVSGLDQVRFV